MYGRHITQMKNTRYIHMDGSRTSLEIIKPVPGNKLKLNKNMLLNISFLDEGGWMLKKISERNNMVIRPRCKHISICNLYIAFPL